MRASGVSAKAVLIGAMALVLAACGSGEQPPERPAAAAPAASAAPQAETAAPEQPTETELERARREMVNAVTVGASTAPVEMRFDVPEAPTPGRPFTVEVAVLPAAPVLTLRGAVTGSAGLEVVAPAAPVTLEKLQAGSVHRFEVTALSPRAGTRVVNVEVTLELATGPASRTFSVPVVVAAREAAPAA